MQGGRSNWNLNERERDAKVKALQDKTANAKADMKTKYEERIAKIRAAYDKRGRN
jgi:hypothetical protein